MNVQVDLKQIAVTRMPCVPTLRVLSFVAVYKGIVVMGKIVQVKLQRDKRIILSKCVLYYSLDKHGRILCLSLS